MTTTKQMKTKKSTFNKHLANQYKQMLSDKNEKSEINTWPLAYNQFVAKKKTGPESWAVLSMNH